MLDDMRSYMKAGNEFVFFNPLKVTETRDAFNKIMAIARGDISKVSMYALPANPGPWDRAGLVGYRRRGEILNDISNPKDENDRKLRVAELAQLDAVYAAADRVSVPLAEVANERSRAECPAS